MSEDEGDDDEPATEDGPYEDGSYENGPYEDRPYGNGPYEEEPYEETPDVRYTLEDAISAYSSEDAHPSPPSSDALSVLSEPVDVLEGTIGSRPV